MNWRYFILISIFCMNFILIYAKTQQYYKNVIRQTSTEKNMNSSIHTSANTYRNRKQFLFPWESIEWLDRYDTPTKITLLICIYIYIYKYIYILFIPSKKQSNQKVLTLNEQTHMNRLNNIPENILYTVTAVGLYPPSFLTVASIDLRRRESFNVFFPEKIREICKIP